MSNLPRRPELVTNQLLCRWTSPISPRIYFVFKLPTPENVEEVSVHACKYADLRVEHPRRPACLAKQ